MTKDNRIAVETILLDGTVDGITQITCTDFNGVCFKLPRNKVSDCSKIRKYIESPAVYILIGKENDKFVYYIGEANNCLQRIKQHVTDSEDYWNTALLFVGNDNQPLDKAIVKGLEFEMCTLAFKKKEESYFELKNGNCPRKINMAMAQEIRVNKYLSGIIILCGILGLNIYEEDTKEKLEESKSEVFMMEIKKNGIKATGYRVNQGFLVIKGSTCAVKMNANTTECFIKERQRLVEEGVIENGKFMKDYTFSSSSAAACQVGGHNVSGPQNWKTESGITLKEIQEKEIKE